MGEEIVEGQAVPYARFKELVDAKNALAKDLETVKGQIAPLTTERDGLSAKLKEEQDKALASVKDYSAKLEASELDALRMRVAVGSGLPLDLAARLQGKTEGELKADAAKIAPLLKPAGPGVPPPGTGSTPVKLDLGNMTPAQIREHAGEVWPKAGS